MKNAIIRKMPDGTFTASIYNESGECIAEHSDFTTEASATKYASRYTAPAEEQTTETTENTETEEEEEEKTMENISAEARELGYLATQYEKYGSVDEEEIIEAYIDEKVEVNISMLGDYNNYLANDNRYDDEIMDWDELEDYLRDMPPLDAFKLAHNSDFTWNDNYFTWNGYGNLVGMEEYAVIDKIKEDRDFLKWYVTENELIDDDTMKEAINYCNHLLKEGY